MSSIGSPEKGTNLVQNKRKLTNFYDFLGPQCVFVGGDKNKLVSQASNCESIRSFVFILFKEPWSSISHDGAPSFFSFFYNY